MRTYPSRSYDSGCGSGTPGVLRSGTQGAHFLGSRLTGLLGVPYRPSSREPGPPGSDSSARLNDLPENPSANIGVSEAAAVQRLRRAKAHRARAARRAGGLIPLLK
jgi:hypothetical protein